MSLRPLITVFGATGTQGSVVARTLLQAPGRPFRVRAVTRRPGCAAAQVLSEQGAELCAADLDDPAGVHRAVQGSHAVFCVTCFPGHLSTERELQQADHVAAAARRADVRRVVWSTMEDMRRCVPHGSDTGRDARGGAPASHQCAEGRVERVFVRRGVPLTRLLTSLPWDELLEGGLPPQRCADGRLAWMLPIGRARLPGIARVDIGACAAALLSRDEAVRTRRIGIAGEHLTGAQMAEALSRALGEPVDHVDLEPADYARLDIGRAADLAALFGCMRDFDEAACAARDVAATRALHPALMRFDGFLARHAEKLPIAPRAPSADAITAPSKAHRPRR
jgi:uncharacterized protein YbjT (DUF2867 family)